MRPILAAALCAAVVLRAGPVSSDAGARGELEALAGGLGAEAAAAVAEAAGRPLSPWTRDAQLALLPPPPAPGQSFRFAVLGDIEPGRFWFTRMWPPKRDAFERQLASLQEREAPAFVLQLGDTVSRGTPGNFARLEETLERVATRPFFPVTGNHDRPRTHGRSDKTLFQGTFGAGDFYFDVGNWRFVLLDNSNWELTRAQLDWLDAVLDTEKRTVVSMHIPPTFLRGRLVKPRRLPQEAPLKDKESVGWFSQGALEFGEIAARRGVSRVYLGHLHTLAYGDYKGVRYVVSGGGGSPLYRAPSIPGKKVTHYIIVEAGPEGLVERVETLRGDTLAFLSPEPAPFPDEALAGR